MHRMHPIVAFALGMTIVGSVLAQTRSAVKVIYAGEGRRTRDTFHAEVTVPEGQPSRPISTGAGQVGGQETQWEVRLQPMTIIEQLPRANAFRPDGRSPKEGAMFEVHAWPAGAPEARRLVWRKFQQRFDEVVAPQWSGVVTWEPGSRQWFIALSNEYGFDVFAVGAEYRPTDDASEYGRRGLINHGEIDTPWGRYFPPPLHLRDVFAGGDRNLFPGVHENGLRWQREGDLLVLVNTNRITRSTTRYVLSPAKAQWVKWGEPGGGKGNIPR